MGVKIEKCTMQNGWFFGYYVSVNGISTFSGVQDTAKQAYKKYKSLERQAERNMRLIF